jgi:hypothetical protein
LGTGGSIVLINLVQNAIPKAIRITDTGGPEVLKWEDVEVSEPGEGQALSWHTTIGEPASLWVMYRAGEVPNALRNRKTKLLALS